MSTRNTFSKLSMVAQYDDLCRVVNYLATHHADAQENMSSMAERFKIRWHGREVAFEQEKEGLKNEINTLQKEVKKLNRQLDESRKALTRETEDKKVVMRDKMALLDQIRRVRQLVENKEDYDVDAHRKRVIRCLDVDRLSPIVADDSDDCVSGLDYDRTEEDILEGVGGGNGRGSGRARRSNAFDEVTERMTANEQPTLLYRFLDKDSDNNDEPRRSKRRSGATRRSSSHHEVQAVSTSSNNRDRMANLNLETDSNMETDNDIEYVRQELKRYESEKKEKLMSGTSTPNVKVQKSATFSAKSAANLMKSASNISTPVPNTLKPHSFVSKKSFRPEHCVPCGGKISFYGEVVKCENCGVVSHPDCKEKCPLPCVKITAPNTRSRHKKILISDYVSDAVPKVPALIVHCCNEIERDENITTTGLYRVVAHTKDIEDLQQKILKSKSGMPNLSKLDVHLLTGVVKRFLQSLDESLITTTLWSYFSEAIKLDSEIERRIHMDHHIDCLPPANQHTLAFLMQHFHAIAKHSDKNLMSTKNLAKTLAPTIVGNSTRNPLQSTILNETKIQVQIMERLFDIEEEFWVNIVPRIPSEPTTTSLGSRLLGTPSTTYKAPKTRANSRLTGTLPTPKLKPLFS